MQQLLLRKFTSSENSFSNFNSKWKLSMKTPLCKFRKSPSWRLRREQHREHTRVRVAAFCCLRPMVLVSNPILHELHSSMLKEGPLDLTFWSFWLFCTIVWKKLRGIFCENFIKNSKEKLVKCDTELARLHKVLYKVVHKISRLQKFNRAQEIEFNSFTAWTIVLKLGTLVHHVHGYKICLRFLNFA